MTARECRKSENARMLARFALSLTAKTCYYRHTSMLGKRALLDAVSKGDISISYEYDLTAETPVRLSAPVFVDVRDPGNLANRIFDTQFFGDRLGLTLGPVVVSDKFKDFAGRTLFRSRPYHFDLTKSMGEIEIMPGESFGIQSVEYVKLGSSTAAYILPRLTLATTGLVVTPTYIDPYWEGLLQLYIANISPHPHSLRFGERIAICRFYDVKGAEQNPELKSQFAQKSHHYGLNWRRILDSDQDVQPKRKRHVPRSVYLQRLREKVDQFLTKWQNFAGLAAGAALVATIFAYARFDSKAGQIDSMAAQIQTLRAGLDETKNAEKALEARMPESGTLEIHLNPNQQDALQDVKLPRWVTQPENILLVPAQAGLLTATGEIVCGPASECSLQIRVQRIAGSSGPLDSRIQWIILGQ